MHSLSRRLALALPILMSDAMAQPAVEAEAKMFTMSAGYERFMGRWSRQLAPQYLAFSGVKDGDKMFLPEGQRVKVW